MTWRIITRLESDQTQKVVVEFVRVAGGFIAGNRIGIDFKKRGKLDIDQVKVVHVLTQQLMASFSSKQLVKTEHTMLFSGKGSFFRNRAKVIKK